MLPSLRPPKPSPGARLALVVEDALALVDLALLLAVPRQLHLHHLPRLLPAVSPVVEAVEDAEEAVDLVRRWMVLRPPAMEVRLRRQRQESKEEMRLDVAAVEDAVEAVEEVVEALEEGHVHPALRDLITRPAPLLLPPLPPLLSSRTLFHLA